MAYSNDRKKGRQYYCIVAICLNGSGTTDPATLILINEYIPRLKAEFPSTP